MAEPALPHPLVDEAMQRLKRSPDGTYQFSQAAAEAVGEQLRALKGKPSFRAAANGLTTLAYMLEKKKNSRPASEALMRVVLAAAGVKYAPLARARGGDGFESGGPKPRRR